jgi:hypothetical protein
VIRTVYPLAMSGDANDTQPPTLNQALRCGEEMGTPIVYVAGVDDDGVIELLPLLANGAVDRLALICCFVQILGEATCSLCGGLTTHTRQQKKGGKGKAKLLKLTAAARIE